MKRVALIVLLSIATVLAADKDKQHFAAGPASSYKGHQTLDKITIAAVPFVSDEETRKAFDKLNPNKYGVLPVLIVIENGTGKALRIDLNTRYIDPEGGKIEATPPDDVIYLGANQKTPKVYDGNPIPLPRREKKGPMNVWEIPGRAFSAKLIPPGESASGFVYFQASHEPGSRLYLTGIKDAASGQDYFYFEVPLERQ